MQMTLIHRRDVIRSARQRWLEQYKDRQRGQALGWDAGRTFGSARDAMEKLDPETCSPADIDEAIEVKGWADNDCDECGKSFPVILRLGNEPDYEARWWSLCLGCLKLAVAILSAAEDKP